MRRLVLFIALIILLTSIVHGFDCQGGAACDCFTDTIGGTCKPGYACSSRIDTAGAGCPYFGVLQKTQKCLRALDSTTRQRVYNAVNSGFPLLDCGAGVGCDTPNDDEGPPTYICVSNYKPSCGYPGGDCQCDPAVGGDISCNNCPSPYPASGGSIGCGTCGNGTSTCTSGTHRCDSYGHWFNPSLPSCSPLTLGDCCGSYTTTLCSSTQCDGRDWTALHSCTDAPGCGICKIGHKHCNSGCVLGSCVSDTSPQTEVCDGLDNDCDCSIDEGLTAPLCEKQKGVCFNSHKRCGGTQGWLACTAQDYGSNYESTETRCDGLDNDCDGYVDSVGASTNKCEDNNWSAWSVPNGWVFNPTKHANVRGECTDDCKVCKDNNVSSAIISSAGSQTDANNVFAPALTQFRADVSANSPNNCVIGFRYRSFYKAPGGSWDENNLIIASSSKLQYLEHVFSSPLKNDFVLFGQKCMPLGSQYKVSSQVRDQKSGRNVSGSAYTVNDWVSSNVLTVVNTPPTIPDVKMEKVGLGAFECTVANSRDPDVDCGFQELTYYARIFKVVEGVAPEKGDFKFALGGIYSLPFYEDANYCCEGIAGDGDANSPVVNSCDVKKPVVHTCGDYGLSVSIGSVAVGDNNTLINLGAACTLDTNIHSVAFKNSASGGVSGGIVGPVPVLCTSQSKSFSVRMDSNAEGSYSVDLNYSPLNCSKSVYFSVITPESPFAPRTAVPDSNIFTVLAALAAVSFILIRRRGK